MCSVSAIMDYGRTRIPQQQWTRPAFDEFKEVIRRLEELDRKLDQPDCDMDEKSEWMEQVEARLVALEADESGD